MTLLQFLEVFGTKDIKITLVDENGNEIIKFYSEGYEGVESDISAKLVKKIDLTSASSLSIVLKDA